MSGAEITSEAFHFPEMNENLKAYKVGVHQHIPEIEQALDHTWTVQYTPHVVSITRGIHTTIVLRPERDFDPAPYYACYDREPFVRVLGEGVLPEVKYVKASNFIDFGWVRDARTGNLLLLSAIDNLVGGTAGMAVQCMNLMFGVEETTASAEGSPMKIIGGGVCAPQAPGLGIQRRYQGQGRGQADCALVANQAPLLW